MNRTEEIISQIRILLDELSAAKPDGLSVRSQRLPVKQTKGGADKYKGCMGGILHLIDEGFFAAPKTSKEVSDELKKGGWHYGSPLISMNLLSLVRQRKLTRIKGKEWTYAFRK